MAEPTSTGSRKSRLRLLAMAAAVAIGVVAALAGAAFAQVSTDQQDYSPGSLVTVSGSNDGNGDPGYVQGHTVNVAATNTDTGWTGSCSTTITATDGSWSCAFDLSTDSSRAVGSYTYTASSTDATGNPIQESGTFTDGNASSVTGTVTDSATSNPIAGATVTCDATTGCNATFTTTTDASGSFVFDASHVGKLTFSGTSANLTLTATKTGYTANTVTFSVTNGGTYSGKDIALTPSAPADTTAPSIALATLKGGTSTAATADPTTTWFNIASVDPQTTLDLKTTATDTSGIKNLSCTDSYKATPSGTPSSSSLIGATYSSPYPSPVSETGQLIDGLHSVSCTATDGLNNSTAGGSETTGTYKVDLTRPSVGLVGGPADGQSYYFGFVPAAPTCNASDATSGLDGSCSVSGYGTAVGPHTVTASATDNAGNTNTASAAYTVLAWTLNGFYQPVDMPGADIIWNTVKGGSTVPLKFQIFAGPTELTDIADVQSLIQKTVRCDATDPTDPIETTATGGTSLRYDTTADQFVYNWKTPKTPGTCLMVTMTTLDSSTLSAYFKLK